MRKGGGSRASLAPGKASDPVVPSNGGSGDAPTVETLSNGMQLINVPMSANAMVGVFIVVKAGARDETPQTTGLAHFLEHMFFKGTVARPRAEQISSDFAMLGGDTNAYTGREEVCYFATGPKQSADAMAAILCDMLTHPLFDSDEMDKERNVVVQELSSRAGSPGAWMYDNLGQATFGGGQALAGNPKAEARTVMRVGRDELLRYHQAFYSPDRMALVVCGGATLTKQRAEELLADLPAITPQRARPQTLWGRGPDYVFKHVAPGPDDEPQVHVRLALPGAAVDDPDALALDVASMILGGSSWSRLFVNVRDGKGLTYYIKAGNEEYSDTGVFQIAFGTRPEDAAEATRMSLEELKRLAADGPTDREMVMARATMAAQLAGGIETAAGRGQAAVSRWVAGKAPVDYDDFSSKLNAITAADVQAQAARIAKTIPQMRVGIFGAEDKAREIFAAAGRRLPAAPSGPDLAA